MRKLILVTVLMLASASAFAGDSRSLSLASNEQLPATPLAQPTVDRTAVNKVAVRLAQAAGPVTDAAPTLPQTTTTTTTQAPAPAPVQTAAPATTTQPATTTTTTTSDAKPAKPAKTTKRESDEHKARPIAAKYGVYW